MSDQGKFNRKSWLVGFVLRLVSLPRVEIVKRIVAYRYNGVQLPDINEIWTEEMKKTYTACVIYRRNSDGVYRLLFGGNFLEYYMFTLEDSDRYFRIGPGFHRYNLINGKWTFSDSSATAGSDNVAPRVADNTMVWTNRALLVEEGGAVYLAASEPVPVYG